MSWRSLLISNPARLSVDHSALVIEQEEKVRVPLEDIGFIVLDHPQILLTHSVLSRAAEQGIALFSVSEAHLPNGIFHSYLTHSRATKMLRIQLGLSAPTKKQIQAVIVASKIANQGKCLSLRSKASASKLASLSRRVRSGDKQQLESQAARIYFLELFGPDFARKQVSLVNASLNFGYAIFRSAIARVLVAHGLCPAFGLFHDNEQNAFNLADDLIEPFRPIVDLSVSSADTAIEDTLTTADKANLVSLLFVEVGVDGQKMSAWNAIETLVASLQQIFTKDRRPPELALPVLLGLSNATQEN